MGQRRGTAFQAQGTASAKSLSGDKFEASEELESHESWHGMRERERDRR